MHLGATAAMLKSKGSYRHEMSLWSLLQELGAAKVEGLLKLQQVS